MGLKTWVELTPPCSRGSWGRGRNFIWLKSSELKNLASSSDPNIKNPQLWPLCPAARSPDNHHLRMLGHVTICSSVRIRFFPPDPDRTFFYLSLKPGCRKSGSRYMKKTSKNWLYKINLFSTLNNSVVQPVQSWHAPIHADSNRSGSGSSKKKLYNNLNEKYSFKNKVM